MVSPRLEASATLAALVSEHSTSTINEGSIHAPHQRRLLYHLGQVLRLHRVPSRRGARRGFHTSQLIDYTLEPNPDAGEDKNAPPQKLVLAFSTADVVILGWRLGRLADLLRENNLATVHVLSKRYADLDRSRPFVASIIITPICRSPS